MHVKHMDMNVYSYRSHDFWELTHTYYSTSPFLFSLPPLPPLLLLYLPPLPLPSSLPPFLLLHLPPPPSPPLLSDIEIGDWQPQSDGTKLRDLSYTLALNYSFGPKFSPSTEHQIYSKMGQPGLKHIVDTEVQYIHTQIDL